MSERPTPRATSARRICIDPAVPKYIVPVEVAEELERELTEAKDQRDRLANACRSAKLCLNGEALPTRHRAIQIIDAALDSIA